MLTKIYWLLIVQAQNVNILQAIQNYAKAYSIRTSIQVVGLALSAVSFLAMPILGVVGFIATNQRPTLLSQLNKRRLKLSRLATSSLDVKVRSWAKRLWVIFKLRVLLVRQWQEWWMFRAWLGHLRAFVVRQKSDPNIVDALLAMHFDELELHTRLRKWLKCK